ncbi:MAG: alkaline phosphatase family protein [Polyangiales bacterium]
MKRRALTALLALSLAPRVVSPQPAPRPLAGAPSATRAPTPYDHVVIVSFDGLRPDGLMRAEAPTLHRLRAEGAWANHASTIPDSSTLPAHSSMLSGDPVRRHGMDFDDFHPERGFIRVPTILYRAHDAGLATAMFVAKPKLRHIAIPGSVDTWSLPSHACERVSAAAARYLPSAAPGVTFIHFGEPDGAGHRRGWMSRTYLDAVARTDRCFAAVMAAIESRADRDRVLVMISADHGGHGRRHGTHRPEDIAIPWIAWGARVTRGDFDEPVNTMDTAATALAALGLPVPEGSRGRVVPRALGAPPTSQP